ncbi:MAG TPA: serpin family protein [Spirochaetota bacterium]|nr:serpin family protein [Spirochaetota bacterium]HOM38269.1 serpin family protein [Spirochaetota bacterium]HPQ48513.1 serpin family protein [Spirochaetota bacterium]
MKKIIIITLFFFTLKVFPSSITKINVQESNNNLGFKILNALDKENKKSSKQSNIFFSPLSIYFAMSMVYIGAKNDTKKEFQNVMEISDSNVEEIEKISKKITDNEDIKLEIANKIWPSKDIKLKNEYETDLKKIFAVDIQQLDYSKPTESANIINSWVARQTNQKIKNLISPDILNPLVKLILTNAIYFNSEWDKKFDKNKTYTDTFFGYKNKKQDVEFMLKEENILFYNDKDLSTASIPYKNKKMSFFIILPEDIDKINLDYSKINSYIAKMQVQNVEIHLPKFKIEYENEFKPIFFSLGIKKAFTPGEADFTEIAEYPPLYIEYILHKAFIEVDEKGTEAAAATAIIMNTKSVKIDFDKIIFKVDKPFIFFIIDNDTKSILFLGKVLNINK